MGRLHERLHGELEALLEGILREELAGLDAASFRPLARRIAESASVRVDGGQLRLLTSPAELREILTQAVGSGAGGGARSAALERAVRRISELEVETATP